MGESPVLFCNEKIERAGGKETRRTFDKILSKFVCFREIRRISEKTKGMMRFYRLFKKN